jgi:hypothetical protein
MGLNKCDKPKSFILGDGKSFKLLPISLMQTSTSSIMHVYEGKALERQDRQDSHNPFCIPEKLGRH